MPTLFEVMRQFLQLTIRECSSVERKYCDFVPFLSDAGRLLPTGIKTISKQAELLGQTMNQLQSVTPHRLFYGTKVVKARSLQMLGVNASFGGYVTRPILQRQAETIEALRTFLVRHESHQRIPHAIYKPDGGLPLYLPVAHGFVDVPPAKRRARQGRPTGCVDHS